MSPEEAAVWRPSRPNILVTGTPGVGKSTLCRLLTPLLGCTHTDVGKFAISRNLTESYDVARKCHILNEDAVLDALEPLMATGGVLLEHHSCDWFPERWIQLVVILRADTEVLYDRLMERGYHESKVQENIQAEVFQIAADEARESFPKVTTIEINNCSNLDKDSHCIREIQQSWAKLNHEA
eukprot:Plantae.Rhodophyta-Hildenbrandia_rubra.ctg291.p2 GENE.Plantae.Rhodophyta-Hildenbrandia_rubra.ctg291~~Plantae.Rhodophyta-Hildenbrandia_rubra.ctg291.p2  ORF type:complete len:182 (-),score=23.96 Plantae.Rhodophyta-Hildenbrandia_rubra.ctg291:2456-3001(-)